MQFHEVQAALWSLGSTVHACRYDNVLSVLKFTDLFDNVKFDKLIFWDSQTNSPVMPMANFIHVLFHPCTSLDMPIWAFLNFHPKCDKSHAFLLCCIPEMSAWIS